MNETDYDGHSNRLYCENCATPIGEDDLCCPNCYETIFAEGEAFITRDSPLPVGWDQSFTEWPLTGIKFPPETTMVLDGGPGTGKTTILMMMGPDAIWSTEQKVPALARRIHQLGVPEDGIRLRQIGGAVVTPDLDNYTLGVDSITSAKLGEQWYHDLVEWASTPNKSRRLIAILQNVKAGVYAGGADIPHGADLCIHLERDHSTGLMVMSVWKNRHGGLVTRYYSLGLRVGRPEFIGAIAIRNTGDGPRICDPKDKGSVMIKADDLPCNTYCGSGAPLMWWEVAERFCVDNRICWHGEEMISHAEGCPAFPSPVDDEPG